MMTQPTIGIVGLGTMGLGIAQVYAAAGFAVIATDAHALARSSAQDRMAAALQARISAGKLTPEARDSTLANLRVSDSLADLAPCALVIEAIIEQAEAKRALFGDLETHLSATAVLATNTSSIPVATIAHGARHPERILALHFFNPPTAMKLVELAPHAGTAAAALACARDLTQTAGKTVVQCPDRPGFIVNRCARPFYGEALALLEEGRNPQEIDAALQGAGYRLGPLSLIDLIGADINLAATLGLFDAMDQNPRYHPFDVLKAQVALGNLGRKSGKGFVYPDLPGAASADAAEIVLRIESTLVNEAAWLLSEGGTTAESIDTALKLGLNFPRGPFQMLALHGKAAVLAMLHQLATTAPPHLRGRYIPAPSLIR